MKHCLQVVSVDIRLSVLLVDFITTRRGAKLEEVSHCGEGLVPVQSLYYHSPNTEQAAWCSSYHSFPTMMDRTLKPLAKKSRPLLSSSLIGIKKHNYYKTLWMTQLHFALYDVRVG